MASKPAPAAPAAPAEGAPAPAKSNKLLIIIIALLVIVLAGGAGWVLTRGHAPAEEHAAAEEHKAEPMKEPKFIPLGEKFTVNLQREEGDQYLQAGITLKILDPGLELKIKNAMPEIRSKLLFLLSSKKPSELVTSEGKAVLVEQVIAAVDGILGFESEVPAAPAEAHATETPAPAAHEEAKHGEPTAVATAPVAPAAPKEPKTTGVVDVLFSDFIIQ